MLPLKFRVRRVFGEGVLLLFFKYKVVLQRYNGHTIRVNKLFVLFKYFQLYLLNNIFQLNFLGLVFGFKEDQLVYHFNICVGRFVNKYHNFIFLFVCQDFFRFLNLDFFKNYFFNFLNDFVYFFPNLFSFFYRDLKLFC